MPAPTTWAIVGASKGLGLELVKQLLERPNVRVVAAVRNPTKATTLQELAAGTDSGRLMVVRLDVAEEQSIQVCAELSICHACRTIFRESPPSVLLLTERVTNL